jgi:hypothetical protein
MKILFIVHRFHTNLFFPIKSLLIHGHQLQMIVPNVDIYDSLIEDHSDLKPIQIIESDISFDFVLKILDELEPDLILQRHFERKWKYFSLIAFFKGIKCIAYDQSPQIGNSLLSKNHDL